MAFAVQSIDHVEVFVRSIPEAIRWYGEVLGLRESARWDPEPVMIGAGGTMLALFQAELNSKPRSEAVAADLRWHRVALADRLVRRRPRGTSPPWASPSVVPSITARYGRSTPKIQTATRSRSHAQPGKPSHSFLSLYDRSRRNVRPSLMCGIAGFFSATPTEFESDQLLHNMTRVLAHRGPDGAGVHRDGEAGLAHTRLAVIDISGGRQPIVSDDGQTAIVLNGEIYNFRALRGDLQRQGCRFRTEGDAEVILQLYGVMGERCVERLRGMFAFAIWDRRKQMLWLARDRIGVKPLYYSWNGNLFLFGSELKAILQHPRMARTIDARAIDDFLTYGYIPSPRTIFQGIQKLSAGHTLRVTASGPTLTEYWDLDFVPRESARRADLAARLEHELRESVACHLVSDVPVGCLLSGGVDSSAVLALMADAAGAGIPALTATFPETRDLDRDHALRAAEAERARWEEVPVRHPTVELLDRLAWHFDEPFADPSAVPTFVLCEAARRQASVFLSGDGGDENFGGYRRYRTNVKLQALRRLVPSHMAGALFRTAAGFAPSGKWLPGPLRLRGLLRDAALSPDQVYWNEMTRCDGESRRSLYSGSFQSALGDYNPYSTLERLAQRSRSWQSTSQLQYWDFKTYLADGILVKVDRASMAHGLETRVPLLDHILVEFVARIPSSLKIGAGRGKHLFKRSVRHLVPPEILRRRKQGFTPPLSRWLASDALGSVFEQRVLGSSPFVSNFLEIGTVRSMWNDQWNGRRSRSYLLWSLLALETWGRQFV